MLRWFLVLALAGVVSALAGCAVAPADSAGYYGYDYGPSYYAPGYYAPGYYAPGYYGQPNVGIGIGFGFGNRWHGGHGWRGGHGGRQVDRGSWNTGRGAGGRGR
jgi:hypothetical protein